MSKFDYYTDEDWEREFANCPENLKPSTESERLSYEHRWNCKRMDDYRRKKEDLEFMDLDNDPEYIKWLDEQSHSLGFGE